MDRSELLPCPFCGAAEHLHIEHLEGTILHPAYRVLCDNCGASTGYTDKDCRADWNTRAAPPPPAEQASGEHDKHMAVLERLERALPDIGLNGWIDGVAAVQYARAALSQRPVVGGGE